MKITRYKKRDHHTYCRDKDGSIDTYAFEIAHHNGPVCERCHYSFCVGCEPDGYENTNCEKNDDCSCEKCNKGVSEDDNFCPKCGNNLKLETIVVESDD